MLSIKLKNIKKSVSCDQCLFLVLNVNYGCRNSFKIVFQIFIFLSSSKRKKKYSASYKTFLKIGSSDHFQAFFPLFPRLHFFSRDPNVTIFLKVQVAPTCISFLFCLIVMLMYLHIFKLLKLTIVFINFKNLKR